MTVLNIEEVTVRKRSVVKKKKKLCSANTVERRLPIVKWLPKYTFATLIQDLIAGVTVGLTAVPQGLAYAVIAGLSPEYGLYSCLLGGFVYAIFGSCKVITIGPTAILSAILAKYVASYTADFAILATFLSGVLILLLGVLRLGFLVDFISTPVISGFTTAAITQVITGQLKPLFGLSGPSGNYFSQSFLYLIQNATTVTLWDSILGCISIVILVLLKKVGEECSRTDGLTKQLRWLVALARNAIVMIIGMIIAFVIKSTTGGSEPLGLIGSIEGGTPQFLLPPFSTQVGNQTYEFTDMLTSLGPQAIVIPFVSMLEIVAISKAFAAGTVVDITQEMIALGLTNIFGSLVQGMPMTGSFSRVALNAASGVQTTLGGIFTSLVVLLALTTMTDAFYYIPRTSLAALIITVLYHMLDLSIFGRLWKSNKKELAVLITTMTFSLSFGLEYGIVVGVIVDAIMLLYFTARPKLQRSLLINEARESVIITLNDNIFYCAAEHVRRNILMSVSVPNSLVIIDGSNLMNIDSTVAGNLMGAAKDLKSNSHEVLLLNFKKRLQDMCLAINPQCVEMFKTAAKVEDCHKVNLIKDDSH